MGRKRAQSSLSIDKVGPGSYLKMGVPSTSEMPSNPKYSFPMAQRVDAMPSDIN
jgi:hypothetical protein